MMTKLREFSKVFIIIVAAAFIGLMVFEWGADYGTRSRVRDTVGSVNGKKLTYGLFTDLYQQLFEGQRARMGDVNFDENDLRQLREQVWEQFIQRTLFEEEMKKLGIAVSDSEIVYQLYNYPLEDFKQHPAFQTDEIFDISKYRAALGDPNIPWLQVEEIYRQQIPFVKLQNIITNTVRVTDQEVLDSYRRQNMKTKVEYLAVNAANFNNPEIEISEAELRKFYNQHKNDYRQEEKRQISYVVFPLKTTARDTGHVFSEFEQIKQRLANGEDFSLLAFEYSMDPSVQKNRGDLGFFDREAMVKPFADAAFAAKVGDIVGPVATSFGFHLIKVEDRRGTPGKEEVKASHILLKVTPAPSASEEQEMKARFFSEDAQSDGFQKMAEQENLQVITTSFFEERSGFIPGGIGNNPAIMNFAFASKLNDVSGVYRLDDGFVVLTVSQIQPQGFQDFESVSRLIENRVRLEKAKQNTRNFALQIAEDVRSGKELKAIADADDSGNFKYEVTGMFTINGNVPGVGRATEFNATAFALDIGQRSDLIETDRAFYYIHVLEKTDIDMVAFEIQKEQLRRRMLTQKRNQIFNDWYDELKQKAKIEDNRKMFNL